MVIYNNFFYQENENADTNIQDYLTVEILRGSGQSLST